MKHLILAFLILFSATTFAQIDTGTIDETGRKVYEKTFDAASTDIEQKLKIDDDVHEIFDHKGVFRIGTQKGFNTFPYDMFVKYEQNRSLLYITVKYEFQGDYLILTAKNSIDDLHFALGIQYYIVVRYTKKQ